MRKCLVIPFFRNKYRIIDIFGIFLTLHGNNAVLKTLCNKKRPVRSGKGLYVLDERGKATERQTSLLSTFNDDLNIYFLEIEYVYYYKNTKNVEQLNFFFKRKRKTKMVKCLFCALCAISYDRYLLEYIDKLYYSISRQFLCTALIYKFLPITS